MRAYFVEYQIFEVEGSIDSEGRFVVRKHSGFICPSLIESSDWFVTLDAAYIKLEKNYTLYLARVDGYLAAATTLWDKEYYQTIKADSSPKLASIREMSRDFLVPLEKQS